MKKICGALLFAAALTLGAAEMLTVSRNGNDLSIKSPFADGWTLTRGGWTGGPNRQYNFRYATLSKAGAKNIVIKNSSDDACPVNLNGSYLGANHGDAAASALIFAEPHGLGTRDRGTEWLDSKGRKFYILRIETPTVIQVLSENLSQEKDIWKFVRPAAGETLTRADGRVLKDFKVQLRQLRPQVRIISRKYLADGKPLEDKTEVECSVFTVEEEYDIVATDAVLKHVIANPGKAVAFNAPGLEAVLNQKIVYRYYPDGSCIVEHETRFLRNVRMGYLGFIQAHPMTKGKYGRQCYRIPKTKPFAHDGEELDFADGVDLTRPIKKSVYLTAGMFADPKNMPERFLQYLSEGEGLPEIGFVCGYSLLEGCTVPEQRCKNAGTALYFYSKTRKTYPHAVDNGKIKAIKAGTVFRSLAYRQYFDPAQGYYLNRQGKNHLMYVDFTAPAAGKVITIPEELRKMRMELVEKSPTVQYRRDGAELKFDSTGKNGYCVLKFE